MKKYIISVITIALIIFTYIFLVYNYGLYVNIFPKKEISTFMTTNNKNIIMASQTNESVFEIHGVDMGSGIPGHFSTEYTIDYDTYLRWFKEIQELGANTIRVYTILNTDFYDALYDFNSTSETPLYLIQGVWVNDYNLNSRLNAFDDELYNTFYKDCKKMVDVIHGNRWISIGDESGTGFYTKNISKWVIGYILGVEWEDHLVTYTNIVYDDMEDYHGKYMYTENASAFEIFLSEIGDKIITYESDRYGEQRLIAFANWPTTDPFNYDQTVVNEFKKTANIDVEHIKTTESFKSGMFASYHIYSYYPDYLYYGDMLDDEGNTITLTKKEKTNTYKAYLKKINEHHTIPVVVSEFGNPTGRGKAHEEHTKGRNQGYMNETEQGNAIVSEMEDMESVGINNYVIFSWQDEWFKRTWNTMSNIDLSNTAYWCDAQTNEQHFGLLSFDPGETESVCYVDGDVSEWSESDLVYQSNEAKLYMKYDEEYVYFYANIPSYKGGEVFIPIDTISSIGGTKINDYNVSFDRNANFVIYINKKSNSRIYVHERYNTIKALYGFEIYQHNSYSNVPDKFSNRFDTIDMVLQIGSVLNEDLKVDTFETGKLLYGNGNPSSKDYNSLSDYIIKGDNIEIRIPWELLNFYTPSKMTIHDDYYTNYGIKEIEIKEMYVGVGLTKSNISMKPFGLTAWNEKVTYHERLKQSYYIIQDYWRN